MLIKKGFYTFLALGSLLFVAIIFHKQFNERSSWPSVAIIDSLRVKEKSLPFLKIRELLEEQQSLMHKDIRNQEETLRKEYETIRTSLDPSSIVQKQRQSFDKKITELREKLQQKQKILNQQFSKLTEKIEHELDQSIKELVERKGIQLVINSHVLEKQVVFFASQSLDITDEVIQSLDRKLPKLSLQS
jgi:Skp family chaperone for outer membrane proteins